MRNLLLAIILIPLITSAQIFEKSYNATTNFAVGNSTQHLYDSINGTYILTGTNASSSTGIIIKINKFGDTLWSKKVYNQPGMLFYPEGFIKLINGNLLLTGYYYGNGFAGVCYQTYNSNGNFISKDSTEIQSIVAYGLKSSGVDNLGNYYIAYRNDSIDPSIVDQFLNPINKFWRMYLEKRDQNNNLLWRKKYQTYSSITNPIQYESVYSLTLNKDNHIIVNVNSSTWRLENYSPSGALQYTLNPSLIYTPNNIYKALVMDVFPLKDSSYILSCQVNDTSSYTTNYRFSVIHYSVNGILLDSASYSNSYMAYLCESSKNDLIMNYYTYSSNAFTSSAGIIFTDKHFNLKSNFPFGFGNSLIGYVYTGKLSANNNGGAFYSANYNINGSALNLKVISFDSLMNTYPNRVSGSITFDNDKNCLTSAPDYSISGGVVSAINASNETFLAFSNSLGSYTLNLPTSTFTIQHLPAPNKLNNCNGLQTQLITIGTTTLTKNYFDTLIPNIKDVEITAFLTSHKPGDTTSLMVYYKNSGSTIFNGTIKIKKDTSFQTIFSSPLYSLANGDTINYTINNLKPDSTGVLYLLFKISPSLIIGSNINVVSTIYQNNDQTPWNNSDTINVLASYISPKSSVFVSPGFKSNSLQVNKPLLIDGNQNLTYRINFQNTNKKIVNQLLIADSLSQHLDLSTFKIIRSSHKFKKIEIKKNILYVTFENINLKDSSISSSLSTGEFVYSILPKQNLPQGTLIKNKSVLAFDLFPQKETNGVVNKINGYFVGIKEQNRILDNNQILIYPNPTNSNINIFSQNNEIKSIEIFSLDGKKVGYLNNINSNTISINIESFSPGVYLLKSNTSTGAFINKLIKY
jgi:hypothetical protein